MVVSISRVEHHHIPGLGSNAADWIKYYLAPDDETGAYYVDDEYLNDAVTTARETTNLRSNLRKMLTQLIKGFLLDNFGELAWAAHSP